MTVLVKCVLLPNKSIQQFENIFVHQQKFRFERFKEANESSFNNKSNAEDLISICSLDQKL
jgi:hypothetical protein